MAENIYLVNTPLASSREGEKVVASELEVSASGALIFTNGGHITIRVFAPGQWKSAALVSA